MTRTVTWLVALRREHPRDADMRVSHESIYPNGYKPSRKAFDASMFHRLRSDRSIVIRNGDHWASDPRTAAARSGTQSLSGSVHSRPTLGKWWPEGDLVFGMRTSAVATLVDRATRYAMVVALPDGRKADAVARALIEQMGGVPVHLRRSLTWDRGLEITHHAAITAALSMPVFFCDPHHSWQLRWQRGTTESTNRLLRQYLHKNADLGRFAQDHLDAVAAKLNHRPRRVLGWITLAEAFDRDRQTVLLAPA